MPGSTPKNASHAAVDPEKGKAHPPQHASGYVALVDVTAQKQPGIPIAHPASEVVDGKQAVLHEIHVPLVQHQL